MIDVERFDSCQVYCNGKFHTTSCSAARGMRPSKLRKAARGSVQSKLTRALQPFLFAAIGRGIKDDNEVLNFAIQEFYAVAVDASFLTTKDPQISKEIAAIRKRLGK